MVYYLTEDNKVQVKYKIVDFNRFTSHYLTDFNKDGIAFALKSKYGEIMIDISEDKAIGYVLVNKAGTIGPIKVYEKYRGHGYSKVLLRDAIDKYHGYKLGVMKDNTVAINLYKSFGFKVVKETKDHYNMELEKSIHESENTDNNDDSILDEIKKFNKLLNSYKYGIPKNGKIGNTSAEDFYKNYRLESIQEFEKNKGGVCWDFVYYEDYYFKKNFKGVPTKLFYIIIDDNKNCPTHTFLTFSYKGKYYWFESSWSKYSGVHVYNSESELTKDVCKKHNMYNTGDYPMYMRSFKSSEVRPGMNTKEYMDVMNKGLKKVNI